MPQEWPMVQQALVALLQACDDGLVQHTTDWLGHCKALIEADGAAAYGSITGAGEPVSWRGTLHTSVTHAAITVYGVVYAVPDEVVVAVVQQALQAHLPGSRAAPAPQQSHTGVVEWLER